MALDRMRRAAYIVFLALLVSCPLPCFAAATTPAMPLAVSPLTSPERVKPLSSAAQTEKMPPKAAPIDPHPFLTEFYGPAKVEAAKPAAEPARASREKAALKPAPASQKQTR